MRYDELVNLAIQANRLQNIGALQAHLLNSLKDPTHGFSLGNVPFSGEDSKRLRIGIIRMLEEMSQEGRMELEAHGITFEAPPPAREQPVAEAEFERPSTANGQAHDTSA
jgi:hypothetical protein